MVLAGVNALLVTPWMNLGLMDRVREVTVVKAADGAASNFNALMRMSV